jgi:hypothetical protein
MQHAGIARKNNAVSVDAWIPHRLVMAMVLVGGREQQALQTDRKRSIVP